MGELGVWVIHFVVTHTSSWQNRYRVGVPPKQERYSVG